MKTREALRRDRIGLPGGPATSTAEAGPRGWTYLTSKRLLDLVVALLLLVITAPLVLAAVIAIKVTSSAPALFRQTRIGQFGKPFTLFKLRTMYVNNDDRAHREFNARELLGEKGCEAGDGTFKLDCDDPRITRVGSFLRRFSIDELPQLLNVLRGDMSLVGPRPSLPWEVELYTAEQKRRHDCLPGITGLWQVSGRSECPMPEMLALDVTYAETRSLLLDLWILLRTPYAVFFSRGHGWRAKRPRNERHIIETRRRHAKP